jgi:hypothetical protein
MQDLMPTVYNKFSANDMLKLTACVWKTSVNQRIGEGWGKKVWVVYKESNELLLFY